MNLSQKKRSKNNIATLCVHITHLLLLFSSIKTANDHYFNYYFISDQSQKQIFDSTNIFKHVITFFCMHASTIADGMMIYTIVSYSKHFIVSGCSWLQVFDIFFKSSKWISFNNFIFRSDFFCVFQVFKEKN